MDSVIHYHETILITQPCLREESTHLYNSEFFIYGFQPSDIQAILANISSQDWHPSPTL